MGTTLYYGPFRRLLPSHIVDSGQLAHNWTSSATPVKIYIGDTLGSYAGTPVPVDGGAVNRFLIGNGGSGSWPANMPPIQNNSNGNYYDSHAYASSIPGHMSCGWSYAPTAYNPSRYTGLMRLAMQAKLGAAKNPDDFVTTTPSNCSPVINAESHGLIYDEDYYFWQIHISSSGAIATKLKNSDATEWCRVNLADGAVTDDKFLAYLLADLTVDTTETPIVMLLASTFVGVYGGREPVAHGWHYTRQAPWKACITTSQEYAGGTDWAYESTVGELDIVFNAGLPEASLTMVQQDQRMYLWQQQPGWVPAGGGSYRAYYYTALTTEPSGCGGGIYYCYYDAAGTRIDVSWEEERTDAVSATSASSPYICGYDSHGTAWNTAHNATTGGWSVGGVSQSARLSGSYHYTESWDVYESATYSNTSGSSPLCDHSCNCQELQDALDAIGDTSTCSITQQWPADSITNGNAHCAHEYTSLYTYNNYYKQFILIPYEDAEATYVGFLSQDWIDEYADERVWGTVNWVDEVHYVRRKTFSGTCPPYTGDWKDFPLNIISKRGGFAQHLDGIIFGTVISGGITNPTGGYQNSLTVSVVTPAGTFVCSGNTAAEWTHVWVGSQSETIGITAAFSYSGDGGYFSNETNDNYNVETVGGYPDMYGEHIDLPIYRLFIGWA